jgi:hypothetical protein
VCIDIGSAVGASLWEGPTQTDIIETISSFVIAAAAADAGAVVARSRSPHSLFSIVLSNHWSRFT